MAAKKSEFLRSCSLAINPDTHLGKLLKSHYMHTSLRVAHQTPVASQMCPHCCSFWSENDYKLKLSKTPPLHKLTKELDKLTTLHTKNALNRKKRLRMKWLQKRVARLKIECSLCQKISSFRIEGTKKKSNKTKIQSTICTTQVENTNISISKKKKKRKDKTAGLKIPVKKPSKKLPKAKNPVVTSNLVQTEKKLQHSKLKKSLQNILQRELGNANENSNALSALLK